MSRIGPVATDRSRSAGRSQPSVQAAPFSVKPDGAAVFPVWFAWNPKLVEPPGGMLAL
jgi:hypothetical protein